MFGDFVETFALIDIFEEYARYFDEAKANKMILESEFVDPETFRHSLKSRVTHKKASLKA